MAEMQQKCVGQWKPALVMIVVNFALAIVNLLLKWILDKGVDHVIVIAYRQAISTIFLTPIAYYWEREGRPKLTARISTYLFFSALIGVTLTQFLFLLGLKYTSATFACAFLNMVPVCTFILAALFRLEKVNIRSKAGIAKVLGTLVCIAGAMLLTLYKGMPIANSHAQTNAPNQPGVNATPKKTGSWAIGTLLLASGSLLWSSWFVLQTRIGKLYPCQYSSTAILSFFSAVQSTILSLIINRNVSSWILKGKLEIVTILYAGMVGSGLCYVAMSWGVKQRGPVFTSAFTPSLQIFVAFFDFSILHEPIYLGSVIGSILVIVGLYILLWGKGKEVKYPVVQQSPIQGEDENGATAMGMQVIPIDVERGDCGIGLQVIPISGGHEGFEGYETRKQNVSRYITSGRL